ncbi:MAG: patatin-like phospholipase family protein [Acidobacteriota bacterium]
MAKKIGLALSGGGARGFAHVGVLKVLLEHGLRFDIITGTSAGSIIGGALAAGMSIDEIESMARRTTYANMMRPSFSLLGLLSNAPMGSFLNREFPVSRFEDLKLPFGAVAYDLSAGEERLMSNNGDLIFAIRASCAVPGIFCPMKDLDGSVLVDGGVSSPLPAAAARAMGADVVIGVDVLSCGGTLMGRPWTALGIAVRSSLSLIRSASIAQHHLADVVIEPAIAHLRPDQISKCDEFITLGEAAARARITEIDDLIR